MYSKEKNRLEFIQENLKAGADVILTSAPLVSEGIDIVETPTIVWFAHEFNTYIMPQANRRSYRLHQTKDVEIYYLAYNKTAQADAMVRIAKKLKAQQQLQGDVASGLAKLQNEDDFVDDIQAIVSDHQHHETEIELSDLPELPAQLNPEIIKTAEISFLLKLQTAKQETKAKAAAAKKRIKFEKQKTENGGNRNINAMLFDLLESKQEAAEIETAAAELINNAKEIAAQTITVDTFGGNLFALEDMITA